MTRTDRLGRKIPEFDRSKANKKGAQTKLAKDPEVFSKMGKAHRRKTGRGNFGKLKDTDPEALKELSRKGQAVRTRQVPPVVRGTE